jgi:hypothetical protein
VTRSKKISKPGTHFSRDGYGGLLTSVSELLEQARRASARTVNAILTGTYWEVGRRIVEFEQAGESRAEYGEALLKKLAVDLSSRFGRGYSRQNLQQMRLFYVAYDAGKICQTLSGKLELGEKSQTPSGTFGIQKTPSATLGSRGDGGKLQTLSAISEEMIPQTLSAELNIFQTPSGKFNLPTIAQAFPLPWSHYVRLLSVNNPEARAFYETEALRCGWSVRQLDRQIATQFYERTSLSKNKTCVRHERRRRVLFIDAYPINAVSSVGATYNTRKWIHG